MRSTGALLTEHRGTIVTLAFVAMFVIMAGIGRGGPGNNPGGPGSGFEEDCDKPVYDTPCGKYLADGDPNDPCICRDKSSPAPPGELELSFEVNAGQAPTGVAYVARPGRLAIELGQRSTVYRLPDGREIAVELAGSAGTMQWQGLDPLPGRVNYLLGNDPKHWHTGIATYRRVAARNVYPGIDVLYYGKGHTLEHDFHVAPHADPRLVRYTFRGVEEKSLGEEGDLVLTSGREEIRWKRPVVYQAKGNARQLVAANYRLHPDGSVGFELGAYDRSQPLVIDPIVLYASYLGKLNAELGHKVATDAQGNIYLVGQTVDAEFPTTTGVFKTEAGARNRPNVTITKLSADASRVIYSTYIGGQEADMPGGIAVDPAGNVYIAGYAASLNFPITPNAAQRAPGNPDNNNRTLGDCFVLKLNAAGSGLLYSTFLGGTQPDTCTAIAVDASGNAYVAGLASSSFATPEGSFQRQLRSGNSPYDGFVARLNADGSRFVAATFLGGNGMDAPTAVAVDRTGNVYVTGFTNSNQSFPVTPDAYQTRLSSDTNVWNSKRHDGFALKFNPDLTSLLYGTYIGGTRDDLALAMALDANGTLYLGGSTTSADFPVTAGAVQTTFKGEGRDRFLPGGDGFVTALAPDGKSLVYSTFLGGADHERVLGIALDAQGNAWLTGNTLSADFPLTNDAAARRFGGIETRGLHLGDAFVAHLAANGRSLLYSTFLGGSGEDVGLGLAVVPNGGGVLVTGGTTSGNFGPTASAVQRNYGGAFAPHLPLGDMFLVRLGDPPRPSLSISGIVNQASYAGGAVAPGEMLVISGLNIGPETKVTAPDGAGLPTVLAGTRVLFEGAEAPIVSVSATEVVAAAPFAIAGRASTRVVVEYRGDRSPETVVPVVAAIPGLFSADRTGKGAVLVRDTDGNALESVQAGSIVTMFGTGAGITDPPSRDGEVATEDFPPLAAQVAITIGGVAVQELYFAGGVKGRPAGVFQVQFRVPEGIEAGEQPVVVRIGEAESQDGVFVTVAPAVQE